MRQSIVLGTAQWGRNYGVTNTHLRLKDSEVSDIISTAAKMGVRKLDTAASYQDAEERVAKLASGFLIQSKLTIGGKSPREIRTSACERHEVFGGDRAPSILIHDWSALAPSERQTAIDVLIRVRDEGLLSGVGISIYQEDELKENVEDISRLDLIQIPISILDQRFIDSAIITEIHKRGVVIQARSIFLQGLLLGDAVNPKFHPDLSRFKMNAARIGINLLDLCIGFIRVQDWIDEVVVGVTSSSELRDIKNAFDSELLEQPWAEWASASTALIDPRTW